MHRNPNGVISKIRFPSLFAEAYNNKTATVEQAVNGFAWTGIMPLQNDFTPDAPSIVCELHGNQHECNDTQKNMTFHQAPMNRELTPKVSQEHYCSKRTQEVIVQENKPNPEKKKNTRKNTEFEAIDFG
jgi:hypothetical protein